MTNSTPPSRSFDEDVLIRLQALTQQLLADHPELSGVVVAAAYEGRLNHGNLLRIGCFTRHQEPSWEDAIALHEAATTAVGATASLLNKTNAALLRGLTTTLTGKRNELRAVMEKLTDAKAPAGGGDQGHAAGAPGPP